MCIRDRGLVVPNIKDAQDLSLIELAEAIQQLTETARLGRTQTAEMQQGTITITNFGVFGMDFGTPILNRDAVSYTHLDVYKRQPQGRGTVKRARRLLDDSAGDSVR